MIMDLAGKRLIYSHRPGIEDSRSAIADQIVWRGLWAVLTNPFFYPIAWSQSGSVLETNGPVLGWFYSPAVVWIVTALSAEAGCPGDASGPVLTDLPSVSTLMTPTGTVGPFGWSSGF